MTRFGLLWALAMVSCVFEDYDTEPHRGDNQPPRFQLDGISLVDTFAVGDSIRIALRAIDPEGDSVSFSTSRQDARIERDTLYWLAHLGDTGLNVIEVKAGDQHGIEDSVAFLYFVRRFGRYHPVSEIKTGMEWGYESTFCDPVGTEWACREPPYLKILDTIRYRALSEASVSVIRSSDSLQRDSIADWDGGVAESGLVGKFGFDDVDASCPGQNPASEVDTVRLSQGITIIRVVPTNVPCIYSSTGTNDYVSTTSYHLINHYYAPGIGLIFTRKYSVTNITSLHALYPSRIRLDEYALVEYGGRPFDFRSFVDSADSLLPSRP